MTAFDQHAASVVAAVQRMPVFEARH